MSCTRSLVKEGVAFAVIVMLTGCFTFGSAKNNGGANSGGSSGNTGNGTGEVITPTPVPTQTPESPIPPTPMDPGTPTGLGNPLPGNGVLGEYVVDASAKWSPVHFAYNQYFIGESEKPKVTALADWLKANTKAHAVVEGHCDERGSEEYNRGLGERRALAVKDLLVKLGVAADRLRTISYGEERPVDTRDTEEAHARNRRAEFVILLPKE